MRRGGRFISGDHVYLQHATRDPFGTRRALLDWLLDRPWLLKLATNYGTDTPSPSSADSRST